MDSRIAQAAVFLALAVATVALSYLYERRERKQRVRMIWLWPAIFVVLAIPSLIRDLPRDPALAPWLALAFAIGIAIGVFRGLAFGVRPGEKAGEMLLRPNLATGAIYVGLLFVNEFVHVFYRDDPNLSRVACSLLVMTVGNSFAVNLTRLLRYRSMTSTR